MSTALKLAEKDLGAIEQVLVQGDLSKLSSDQRIVYYNGVHRYNKQFFDLNLA